MLFTLALGCSNSEVPETDAQSPVTRAKNPGTQVQRPDTANRSAARESTSDDVQEVPVKPKSRWEEFCANGNFTIRMPGEPTIEKKTKFTFFGAATFHMATSQLQDGTVLQLMYVRLSKAKIEEAGEREVLTRILNGATQRIRGETKDEKQIRLGSHPGIERRVVSGDTYVQSRIYLVSEWVIMLTVGSLDDYAPTIATPFFDSLAIE